MSAYVNEFGRVYFLDMGVIRYIDDQGLVRTLAGQPRNFGVGYNPLSARFSRIDHITVNSNDVYVGNVLENMLEKFSLSGENLSHVAGNSIADNTTDGTVALTSSLPMCGWSRSCMFTIDPVRNRLYRRGSSAKFSYIDLSTGLWNIAASSITTQPSSQSSSLEGYTGIDPNGTLLTYIHGHYGATARRQRYLA